MDDLKPLVTRSQAGDADAYGELVRRFQDMAYGYAYALLHNLSLAQDAAQEAFVEAYRCLPLVCDGSTIRAVRTNGLLGIH